jgi:hypothetical protein
MTANHRSRTDHGDHAPPKAAGQAITPPTTTNHAPNRSRPPLSLEERGGGVGGHTRPRWESVELGPDARSNRYRMMRARPASGGCPGLRSWLGVPPGGGPAGTVQGGPEGRGRVEAAVFLQASGVSPNPETGEVSR